MKIEWKVIEVNKEKIHAKVTIKEKGDKEKIKHIYNLWKILNTLVLPKN